MRPPSTEPAPAYAVPPGSVARAVFERIVDSLMETWWPYSPPADATSPASTRLSSTMTRVRSIVSPPPPPMRTPDVPPVARSELRLRELSVAVRVPSTERPPARPVPYVVPLDDEEF